MGNTQRVLITGGAGFVGSHLADSLAREGYGVTLLDNLEPQVHGRLPSGRPGYLDPDHRLVVGDVRDAATVRALLRDADVVVHLAALVGVGQSMYEVRRYTEVNTLGAANLLELLAQDRADVRKLVVASSMSIYGEGAYVCGTCGPVAPRLRTADQLARREWDPRCDRCEEPLTPIPTREDKALYPTSVYAINKRDHEEMFLAIGQAYGIPTVALRFFNIYGSRQALSNPYTGVAAIFCGRILSGLPPTVYEDGNQLRDFVHVSDVTEACRLAIERPEADGQVLNVGSGRSISIREVAEILSRSLGWEGGMEVTERFRVGDVRHCFADVSRARTLLGYEPQVRLEEGVTELIEWVARQKPANGHSSQANRELLARGLVR